MAKKISNTTSTLQLNFEQDKPKRKMDGAVLYRFQLIVSAFLFLIGTLLLVSFGSSFFVGVSDQSEVERGVVDTIQGSDIPIKNLAGLLGAKIAHFFLFKTFGWSTLLLIPLFYLSALKVGFKKELFSLERLSWQVLFYILWLSLLAGFFVFSLDLPHSIGGGVGYFVNEKLYQLLGYLSIFVIGFGGFIFLVLFYQLNPKKASASAPVIAEEEDELEESLFVDEDGPAVHVDNDDLEKFRPIVPAVVEEVVPEPEVVAPEPEIEEEKKEDDLDFTFKVAGVADEVIEEEPTPASREIKANDLVEQFGLYDPTADLPNYQFPTIDLLKEYDQKNQTSQVTMDELKANKEKIVETLLNYGIGIQKIEATIGPTVTLYEIVPKAGVRVSKITSLEDDLSLSLAAMGVRIIGQMPGKDTIGIEVANKNREMVPVRAVIGSEKFQKSTFDLPITLGKTISNEIFVADLAKMPHLLMAGATGQGKSVGLNMLLTSLIYKKHPATLKFVL
ncbi:MAG: hypothetical protein RL449_1156, partial [Bacteroidota bacterium]